MRISPPLSVAAGDSAILQEWVEKHPASSALGRRARIVLLCGTGRGPSAVAADLGCSKQTVITWRERYRADGIAGLRDAPRSGRPVTVDPEVVIARTLAEPPDTARATRWTTRGLAAELGISNVAVANVWRGWGVIPGEAGSVRLATDPPLALRFAVVTGLYIDASTRIMALRSDGSGDGNGADGHSDVGALLGGVDPGRQADPAAREAFSSRLAGQGRCTALLVGGPGTGIDDPARGPAVHVPAPGPGWGRIARVVCLLAAGSAAGAASVRALREDLAAHVAGRPFQWVLSH